MLASAALRAAAAPMAAAALGLLCAGCPVAPPPSQFPTAEDALGRMKDTLGCANGIQGEGRLDHLSPRGRVRGSVLIFAINPARVRFDVVSPFGAMLYTLTSNGTDFQMLDFGQKRFLHGPASACNLARLTQVPVPGHVLVSLLRGEAPLLQHRPEQASIEWDAGGFYRVWIDSTRQARQEVRLAIYDQDFDKPWGEQRVRVTAVTTSQQGAVLYEAELGDHELARTAPPREDPDGVEDTLPPSGPACDVELPRRIRIRVPNSDDDALFEYKSVALNPPIPDGAFSQSPAAGTRAERVDCE
jgi:hypothetical protein